MRIIKRWIYGVMIALIFGAYTDEGSAAKKSVSGANKKVSQASSIAQIRQDRLRASGVYFSNFNNVHKNDEFAKSRAVMNRSPQYRLLDQLIDDLDQSNKDIRVKFGLDNFRDIPLVVLLLPQNNARNSRAGF